MTNTKSSGYKHPNSLLKGIRASKMMCFLLDCPGAYMKTFLSEVKCSFSLLRVSLVKAVQATTFLVNKSLDSNRLLFTVLE